MKSSKDRAERRWMHATAERIAARIASNMLDYDADGRSVRITNPVAIAVLQKAFALMLERGGKMTVVQISTCEMRAFPRSSDIAEGVHALAVGLDVAGQATYALQTVAVIGHDDNAILRGQAVAVAEDVALRNLAQNLAVPGFPIPEPERRA